MVEHKFGELTQKVFAAGLHQGVAECHAVVSHRFAIFKIIILLTITLPDAPQFASRNILLRDVRRSLTRHPES